MKIIFILLVIIFILFILYICFMAIVIDIEMKFNKWLDEQDKDDDLI